MRDMTSGGRQLLREVQYSIITKNVVLKHKKIMNYILNYM